MNDTEFRNAWHTDDINELQHNGTVAIKDCEEYHLNETKKFTELYPEGFCDSRFDKVTCWPPTPLNTTAVMRCFDELDNIKYDTTYNATKECMWNGNWAKANYIACNPLILDSESDSDNAEIIASSTIYFTGYSISLLAVVVATSIFLYYKDLKCLRNRIHTNLMCAYMGLCFTWILYLRIGMFDSSVFMIIVNIILHYFHLTTFFWMFVEGMYLYILVVQTLKRENFKLRYYICIGWGLPLVFIIAWVITKSMLTAFDHVALMKSHPVDWIHQGPTVGVLILNLVFLVAIMYVLITKLRSTNNAETKQYRKAAKALLVLMPLLGVVYVLTISAPTTIFSYIRAVLLSMQGFTVALFYCFLNTEVQNSVKHHFVTWKTSRTLGQNRLRSGSRSKDWSPRSRTESIRLYSQPLRKRESCTSDMTTTTVITVNGGRSSNGGGAGLPQSRSPFLQPPRPSYPGNV